MRGQTDSPAVPRIHGAPGERARFAGVVRALWPLLGAMFVAGILVGGMLPRNAPFFFHGLPLFLVAVIAFGAALGPGRRRINAFFSGARGEELVGAELTRLPGGYDIFNGVDLGASDAGMSRGSDLDHVVVGPFGACVIETKAWNGVVTVENGRILANGAPPTRSPIAQARQSAAALSAWLKANGLGEIPVRSVVCFAGNGGSRLLCKIDEVEVCGLPNLLNVISESGSAELPRETLSRAVELLSPLVDM